MGLRTELAVFSSTINSIKLIFPITLMKHHFTISLVVIKFQLA